MHTGTGRMTVVILNKEGVEMKRSLFDNLVNSENALTELLCNLFEYRQFLETFLSFIGINEDSQNFTFDTQISVDSGRPDLQIMSESVIIYLENKVNNTPLTGNQPEGYIKSLSKHKSKNKYLVFLIPKCYAHKVEIGKRSEKIKKIDVETKIYYWEDLLDELKNIQFSDVENIISCFVELLSEWFGYDNVNFSEEEIAMLKNTGTSMKNMCTLIDNVAYQLEKYEYKCRYDSDAGGEGYFILNKKRQILAWIGFWFELWAATGSVLVCLIGNMHWEKSFKMFPEVFKDAKPFKTESIKKGEWVFAELDSQITGKSDATKELTELLLVKLNELNEKCSHLC